jgi:tetratricopeptide (TPR) repeat protein
MMTLLLALSLAQFTPTEAQALFVEGNDAYYKQDLATAKERYQKLLAAGLGGPDVLFNLGTAHLAAGELGQAVVYLERARRLADDDDIEANLALARKQQVDQVVGEESAVPFTWRLADAVDEHLVSAGFLACWWLGFAAFWWWRRASSRLLPALATAALLTCGAALGAASANHAWVRRTVVESVVTAPSVKVLEFPGANAKTSFEVHAGLKVRVMESSGNFVRIRLPNALEGWAARDTLVEL